MRRATANRNQSGPTPFSIVLARIGISDKHAAELSLRFGEVDPGLRVLARLLALSHSSFLRS
jgi:hypothetical protein